MVDPLNSPKLIQALVPHLQNTYCRQMSVDAVQRHTSFAPLTKICLVGSTLVGVAETVTYLALLVFAKALTLISTRARSQTFRYTCLCKGAAAATAVACLTLWDSSFLKKFEVKLEKWIDDAHQEVITKGLERLKERIALERKKRSEELTPREASSATRTPFLWKFQVNPLKQKMKELLEAQKAHYPQKKEHKYVYLQQEKRVVAKVHRKATLLTYAQGDRNYASGVRRAARGLIKKNLRTMRQHVALQSVKAQLSQDKSAQVKKMIEALDRVLNDQVRCFIKQKDEEKKFANFVAQIQAPLMETEQEKLSPLIPGYTFHFFKRGNGEG